jgi:glutathione S-transferase
MGSGYTLIGTDFDPGTAKLRSLLHWKGIFFEEKQATPEVGRDILEPAFGDASYPALLCPRDNQYLDASQAVDALTAADGDRAQPDGLGGFLDALVELYADEWLSIPAAYYRWSHDDTWIIGRYASLAGPEVAEDQREKLGRLLAEPALRQAGLEGVSEETADGIEAHYEGFLADFGAHLSLSPYLFGDAPRLADIALFGPLYASLYLDPPSGAFMRKRAPLVAGWIERILHRGANRLETGAAVQVESTVLPLLKRQMSEQGTELAEAARLFDDWAGLQVPGAKIPDSIGSHEFLIGGRRGERSVFVRPLWKLQRLALRFHDLGPGEKTSAGALMDEIGGGGLVACAPRHRIGRRQARFVLEPLQ